MDQRDKVLDMETEAAQRIHGRLTRAVVNGEPLAENDPIPGGEAPMAAEELESSYSASLIYIDAFCSGDFSGSYRNLYSPADVPFRSAAELLLSLDRRLDELKAPQAYMARRDWEKKMKCRSRAPYQMPPAKPPRPEGGLLNARRGKECTFLIYVYSRQHASWQGKLRRLDSGRTRYFRSVLELLNMLALDGPRMGPLMEPGT